jgi:hypothetical protein
MSYAALDGPGEVYLDVPAPGAIPGRPGPPMSAPWAQPDTYRPDLLVAVRVPARLGDKAVRGRLFIPGGKGMIAVRFELPLTATKPDAEVRFAAAKGNYFARLEVRDLPGSPWFRHQIREANSHARRPGPGPRAPGGMPGMMERPQMFGARRMTDVEQTYALFSGGRAISENLQFDQPLLDRGPMTPALGPAPGRAPRVKLDTLAGITVAELDWKARLGDRKPELDPLARSIPADQHALFLTTLDAAKGVLGAFHGTAIPVLELADQAAEVVPVQRRYERQLGVRVSDLERFQAGAGPDAIRGVAVTGSDPYFATGTDLALLLDVRDTAPLVRFLRERLADACREAGGDVRVVEETREGVPVAVARTPDRSLSAYVAALDGVVVLSNSPWQVEQCVRTTRGRQPRLADAPEYRFFRARYPRGAEGESALVVLTDATIRRWCGPRWRIASSRRVRVAALLDALQADHLEELVAGHAAPRHLDAPPSSGSGELSLVMRKSSQFRPTGLDRPDPGELSLGPNGVVSSVYGTVAFQTPIAEIPLGEVSQSEADFYGLWRDGYQSNWRAYFDPIAIRLAVQPGRRLAADVTVMPLIIGTTYRPLVEVVGHSAIAAGDGDPHPEALAHAVIAIDTQSPLIAGGGDQAWRLFRIPRSLALGWIGRSAAVYVDDDPFWSQLAQAENASAFRSQHATRIPVAVQVKVNDGVRLAAFLAAVRVIVEQSSPGMLAYEVREHAGRSYVRVTSRTPMTPAPGGDPLVVCYAATPEALVVSLREELVTRFLDRLATGATPAGARPASPVEWLGESLSLKVSHEGLRFLGATGQKDYLDTLRQRSWSNLPILNEYHRLFPDRDPVVVHESVFGVRPVCPGGGRYVWNEAWCTMESSAFGCPAAPKPGPAEVGPFRDMSSVRFGVTLEDQGLRARAAIDLRANP